jgi:GTP-binding protein Era
VQELVREQIFLATRDEVPYGVAVVLEEFTEKPTAELTVVKATILVDRENHKPIVSGTKGERIKAIGRRRGRRSRRSSARRCFLELFVRVEPAGRRARAA